MNVLVMALADLWANVDGDSMRLELGQEYWLPVEVAGELQRAGYVVRLPPPAQGTMETAALAPVEEKAVTRRKPARRKRAAK